MDHRWSCFLWAAVAAAPALASDPPSTYPGCATRSASVAWGGSVTVDLSDCHSFGLGPVTQAPAHGQATPAGAGPASAYQYVHGGSAPAGGGRDVFVLRDDNSHAITVQVSIGAPSSALAITPAALPALQAGRPVSVALAGAGGRAPYRFALAGGTLPAGVALAADGKLAGTPTSRAPYAFDLEVRDAAGQSTRRGFAGTVAPGPLSVSPASATITRGQPARLALTARGGVAPHRFALDQGRLPEGLRLSPEGVLGGVATGPAGSYPLVLRVTDASTGDGDYFELETVTLRLADPANGDGSR